MLAFCSHIYRHTRTSPAAHSHREWSPLNATRRYSHAARIDTSALVHRLRLTRMAHGRCKAQLKGALLLLAQIQPHPYIARGSLASRTCMALIRRSTRVLAYRSNRHNSTGKSPAAHSRAKGARSLLAQIQAHSYNAWCSLASRRTVAKTQLYWVRPLLANVQPHPDIAFASLASR